MPERKISKISFSGRKNVQLNKVLQNFMYTMLQDESEIAQKKSLDVMIDLYRRGIWRDAKTVNVMAQACLSTGKVREMKSDDERWDESR